jgi:cardiolipin synthase
MDTLVTILAVALPLIEILGILTAVHAVMNVRTAQGAVAWSIALVTFPFVTLVLYAIFGRNRFQGYVTLRTRRDARIRHLVDALWEDARQNELTRPPASDAEQALTRLAEMPILKGNRSRLLIDGRETFDCLFEDIAAARSYILVQFFTVKDDRLGRRLQSALIRKARQSVRVYFLYDEIGSHKLPSRYLRDMQRAGIQVNAFHSTRGRTNHFQLNFRNHRKIVVIDGRIAFVGGHNVGDEYLSEHPRFGRWRDTHLRVAGPVVKAVQFAFLEDWHWAARHIPEWNWQLEAAPSGSEEMLLVASGPADPLETCGLMFVQAIHMARTRVWIASPYFVPDIQILSALKLAALRGVDVRILLPDRPDHRTVHLASFAFYARTLPAGIKLYRYTAGFMHQKVFLVDRQCSAVGSANLDNRSFRLNFELTLLNFDRDAIRAVETMLREDFDHSRRVALEEYSARGFAFRLAVQSARLLAPVL